MIFGVIILSLCMVICYMDTYRLIMMIKTDGFFKDIDKWFDTSIFDENDSRPLIIGKSKKVIGKFEIEVGSKIITPF